MTDSTGIPAAAASSAAESVLADAQSAQAGGTIAVEEPKAGWTVIHLLAPGETLHLDFDPAAVAAGEIKDGDLELTFDNAGVAVIRGFEAWAAAGGRATGPLGGAVDVAQFLAQDGGTADAPVCEIPNANVVDVPVPSAGERLTLAVQPGDVIRLACSFRDIAGAEVGDALEMTFPGGGVVVVENFGAWLAAQGATITDCVCGGVNLAEFVVALGLNPEDVLPAAGEGPQGGPQGNDVTGSGFTPGPGPQILSGYPYPNILPPTGLEYGVPEPDETFFPVDEDGAPNIGRPDAATVEEDNLPGGIDENADIAATATGSLALSFGGGPGDITAGSYAGPPLTSGGDDVTVTFDDAANTFTGTAGGETVFTAVLDPAANQYVFTLFRPLDQPAGGAGGDEQALGLSFDFTATGAGGSSADGSFTVNVRDDLPAATDDTVAAVANTINLVIVFDRSGSMDEDPNAPGFTTRIDLARAAVASMLAAYESVANVNVLVVDFAASAANSGWLSGAAAANAYLAGLDAQGETNYAGAIQEVIASYSSGLPDAGQALVYFLSDGKPNPASTSLAASGTLDDWESFLASEGIGTAFAVGIGPDVDDNDGDVSDVAFPNDDPGNVIIVSNESETFDALVATVVEAGGSVLTDPEPDRFGADGPGSPRIVSIEIDGDLYEFDGMQVTRNGAFFGLGATIVVITALGGELTFDFGDGDYSYDAPGPAPTGQEAFVYTIADNDGDTSSATLTINLDELQVAQPNRVFGTDGDDGALSGSAGTDIMGGGDGNDNLSAGAGDDHISGGAGADTIAGGSGDDVIVGGNQGEATNSPGTVRPGGDDLGDIIDGGAGDDVIFGNEGADSLSGSGGDDLIFGGSGADTLLGGTGADTISGGSGNDLILGGHGDDVIDLLPGGGSDIVRSTSTLDGHDVINGFGAGSVGRDFVDLEPLLDSLGIATADRAARVEIADNGLTVDINVDADGDIGNGFELALATLATAGTITAGTGADDHVQLGTL